MAQTAQFTVDGGNRAQRMDGFGVNINSKDWKDGKLKPVMELLIDDLGATILRVDVFGKCDWIDEDGTLGKEKALSSENLEKVYSSEAAKDGWGLLRYLNERGFEPYVTCTGVAPKWMMDGKILRDYDSFCEMIVSYVDWAKKKEGIRFSFLSPLNETDLGPPEGPYLEPKAYVDVCRNLDKALTNSGYSNDDIKLIVPEQYTLYTEFLDAFSTAADLTDRIGLIGIHQYTEFTPEQFGDFLKKTADTYPNKPLWMTEYGDLDQTGEKEWQVAWDSTARALSFVKGGFQAGVVWDAFDNFHEHDDSWTIYGLIRVGNHARTPKKRYYAAKHLYRFVKPGFVRLQTESAQNDVELTAFMSPDGQDISLVGMNASCDPRQLSFKLTGLPEVLSKGSGRLYTSTESENFTSQPDVILSNETVLITVPPRSIFTLTTL